MKSLHSVVAILFALVALPLASRAAADPELKSWLGSAFTIPGEETELWISVLADTRPDNTPAPPPTENVTIRFLSDPVYPQRTRERLYVFKYSIRSYAEGTHTIPPFEVVLKGQTLRSQEVTLHVSPLPENAWNTYQVDETEIRFAGTVFTPQRLPFEGETFSTEAKIYLPGEISVSDSSIAELEHDGIAAWRFEASKRPYTGDIFLTTVRLDGRDYSGVSFRSTATPIRPGPVSLGPGHARIKLVTQIRNRGITVRREVAVRLPIPQARIESRPLPLDAPEGFEKAVGRFTLSATADLSDLQEGDPISLLLSVSGVGNLDTLAAPKLIAGPSEWKVYPPGRLERQGERRDVSGVVTFSQIIRPLGSQRVIPPFRLVVFDPQEERFTTVNTPLIPFEVASPRAASSAPLPVLPDVGAPTEQMEGILGVVDPARQPPVRDRAPWWRFWQLAPALLAILLVGRIVKRHLLTRLRRPSAEREILHALAAVEQAGPGAREFLRAAGRFVESWIPGGRRDGETDAILERRDHECYRLEANPLALPDEDRRRIVRHLRERALTALALLLLPSALLLPQSARAETSPAQSLYRQAEAAWNEGSFHAALDLYRSAEPDRDPSADVQYNMGNCYFQLEERGLAALHYHRALALDPHHPEARQNLRFLERKTGSITLTRPDHEEWLGKLDRSFFTTLLQGGLWMTALGLLGLLAALSRTWRLLIWTGLAAGPLVALTGGTALYLYPKDLEFAPLAEQAIVITPKETVARTEASVGGATVIAIPPGSLCRPLARRGPWTYLELADRTRGWLPSEEIRMIVPDPAEDPAPVLNLGA